MASLTYKVGIDKAYFPKPSWPTELTTLWEKPVTISASSRTSAALAAWQLHSTRWLASMAPHLSSLPRKVSLYVDAPDTPSQGTLTRLTPIRVLG